MARKQASGALPALPQPAGPAQVPAPVAQKKAKVPAKVAKKKPKEPGEASGNKKVKAGDAARAALRGYKDADPSDKTVADAAWTAHRRVLEKSNDRPDLIVVGKARELVVGIPLPALCLKYLIQSSVLPVGRMYQITGLEGSGKSSLLAELMRWGLIYDGYGMVFEAESKDIAELREAIWEHNRTWLDIRALYQPCNSMDVWMKTLGSEVDEIHRINAGFGGSKGVGWRDVYIFGVDAFTSAATDETLAKLAKEGPGRSHPLEANLISQYGRSIPDKLRGTSIIIAGTNHLKPKRDDNGNEVSHSPGGRALKFMESIEFEMERQGRFKAAKRSGVWLWIETMKNSLGERLKSIRVALVWDWRWNEPRQDWVQYAFFDWHSATVDMLLQFERDKDSKATWTAITDILDINDTSGGRFWSKRLGIPQDKPVSRHEFGRAIDYDLDLQVQLYPLLGITRRSIFRPGTPIADTIRVASAEADAKLANLYAWHDRDLNEFAEISNRLHGIKTGKKLKDADPVLGEEVPVDE
jgi:hypothetical protein